MSMLELRKGAHVAFDQDEVGYLEGTIDRYSALDDAWLVRTKLGARWVPTRELRPPRAPQGVGDHAH